MSDELRREEAKSEPKPDVTPPKQEAQEAPVEFGLGGLHRLVARRKLKDRVKFLEEVIKAHRPLVEAMKVTQRAYQQGVMEGIRQVAAAEREKEEAQKAQDTQSPEASTEQSSTPPSVPSDSPNGELKGSPQ